ncbi:HNH endonuclease signature motif containing protein [Mycolicibacterium goodii]|uniref:HNH endonuclease signature motif containing protein n=1 Tax=Mycolicibacterium goodii TaxID=134601 RepID=UPI0027DFA0DC|nr:HNH endonuclease signature motif containing protein [Mycolicibacterium goodii]
MIIPERVAQRAHENWEPNENGCHISKYSTQSRGYAQIGWFDSELGKTRMTTAHRAAWVHVHGQIEGEMDVDHIDPESCDRRCVNVDHLRLLTPSQNRQQQGRKHPLGLCTRGHDESHRRMTSRGMVCGQCRREWNRESYARRKRVAA